MKCEHCGSETCTPVHYHLCPACQGEGCPDCEEQIIPGILPGEIDSELGGNIGVCTQFADPEMDSAIDDSRDSLIRALIICRDNCMQDLEERDEAL